MTLSNRTQQTVATDEALSWLLAPGAPRPAPRRAPVADRPSAATAGTRVTSAGPRPAPVLTPGQERRFVGWDGRSYTSKRAANRADLRHVVRSVASRLGWRR